MPVSAMPMLVASTEATIQLSCAKAELLWNHPAHGCMAVPPSTVAMTNLLSDKTRPIGVTTMLAVVAVTPVYLDELAVLDATVSAACGSGRRDHRSDVYYAKRFRSLRGRRTQRERCGQY